MDLQSMICPKCGGQLYFEKDQDTCFCSHCGTQVFKNDNSKKSYTFRTIDEARIKESDNKKAVALKQLELQENNEKRTHKLNIIAGLISLLIPIFIIGLGVYVFSSDEKEYQVAYEEMSAKGLISAGGSYEYRDKNYKSAIATLEAAGFTDIETVDLNDDAEKKGIIDTIVIDGKSFFKRTDFFEPDVKIVITYH